MSSSVSITFIQSNGTKKEVNAKTGSSLMEVGIENDVGIQGIKCPLTFNLLCPHFIKLVILGLDF